MTYHLTRIPGLGTYVEDETNRMLAKVIGTDEDAERIVYALTLADIIDHRTAMWKSIAEKWQDGSKL